MTADGGYGNGSSPLNGMETVPGSMGRCCGCLEHRRCATLHDQLGSHLGWEDKLGLDCLIKHNPQKWPNLWERPSRGHPPLHAQPLKEGVRKGKSMILAR